MNNSDTGAQPPDTVAVREAQKFDVQSLQHYLEPKLTGFTAQLAVRQFEGGQSNPTFLIESGSQRFVLRKKPPGNLLASAHQVEREYRILDALQNTGFPVPKVHLLCEDISVIGTSFFVMDYIEGRVFRDPKLPTLAAIERQAIYESLCQTAAALHKLDWRKLGLADFGKQQEYLARQISRWSIAYEATKTVEIPAMEKLMEWLTNKIPAGDEEGVETSIAHGDFRLENMIFHPSQPKVVAVLDWELSTLGHPLADLAYCCIPYHLPSSLPGLPGLAGLELGELGIPSEGEFVKTYEKLMGRPQINEFSFFLVFSLFRLAAIAQGIRRRAAQGIASSEKAEKVGSLAKLFADTAWKLASQY